MWNCQTKNPCLRRVADQGGDLTLQIKLDPTVRKSDMDPTVRKLDMYPTATFFFQKQSLKNN